MKMITNEKIINALVEEFMIQSIDNDNETFYNSRIKTQGGHFNINTIWRYSGTSFIDRTFLDRNGEIYKIILGSDYKRIIVHVFHNQQKVAQLYFKFDKSNILRNTILDSVIPSLRKRGIEKAAYDFVFLEGYTIKPSFKRMNEDDIKLWNTNIKGG